MTSADVIYRPPSEHYENFPVASWLCPPALRAPVAAIYWFARTADDIADEGTALPAQRLSDLAAFRQDLLAASEGRVQSGRWPRVFDPLAVALRAFGLPVQLLRDLLDAFEQDVIFTASGRRYRDEAEVLDYCRRSANPVGRLLLHMYGVRDPQSLACSDCICTALQLINFWQDLGADIARARWYLSDEQMARYGVVDSALQPDSHSPASRRLVAGCAHAAWSMMMAGVPLTERLDGRAGWELCLVVQGGLRILEQMAALGYATWRTRPKLSKGDLPLLLWRAWRKTYWHPTPVLAA